MSSPRALVWILAVVAAAPRLAQAEDLRLDYVRESLTATYRHSTQYLDGLPVIGGEVIERTEHDGRTTITHRSLAQLPERSGSLAPHTLSMTSIPPGRLLEQRLVVLNEGGVGRRAWRVVVEAQPHRPWVHYLDAVTGETIRSEPWFSTAKGRVFDVNPVAKLNRPDLRDQNDAAAAVPDSAYSIVDLLDLPASGLLVGPYVQIVDTQDPRTPHADAGQSLLFDRSQPQFEEVNAYFQIDRSQRYLQSLGYNAARSVAAYPVPVDPHAVGGTDNSFYSGGSIPGQGALYFGDGGTDDAEDSDIILHEYAHVLQDWIAPGAFFGTPASESRALGEGIGDYWAFSSTYAATVSSGRDPYCLADWDARCNGDDPSQDCGYPAGADCLRRVDGTKSMADFLLRNESGTEHENGTIWSSALREIFDQMVRRYGLEPGKRRTDQLVIESMFGVSHSPTYAELGRKLLDADRALDGAADANVICTAMTSRGILGAGDCDLSPRGDVTFFQSAQQGLAIPDASATGAVSTIRITDARSIERISVDVDIEHARQGDLEIVLTSPDGTRFTLAASSNDQTPFTRKVYGLTAIGVDSFDALRGRSAAGIWTLTVRDVHTGVTGSLRSWGLLITFVGDRPLAARPFSASSRRHLAVAGHGTGASGSFQSSLSIFNRGSSEAHVTLVWTPRGESGWTRYAAANLVVPAGATVTLDDVVFTLLQSNGIGQLEILGDVDPLVMVGTATLSGPAGDTREAIAVASSDEAVGMGSPVVLVALENDQRFRTNVGLAETAGETGIVQFTFRDAAGGTVGVVQQTVLPLSHLQIPMPFAGALLRADVAVVSGKARVLAYASVIDRQSGDGMYVPALPPAASNELRILPAIHADGEAGTAWRTDVTLSNVSAASASVAVWTHRDPLGISLAPGESKRLDDVRAIFGPGPAVEPLKLSLPAGFVAISRTWTPCMPAGSCGEYGRARLVMPASASDGPIDVIGLEESPRFRSNIGLINPDGEAALVRLTAYDAGGFPAGSAVWSVGPGALLQVPLRSLVQTALIGGRVRAEIMSQNETRLIMYGSVIDKVSQDPIQIDGDQ